MSEKPIKLFATMSERYPEADDSDKAVMLTRSAIGAAPLGGMLLELLSPILGPPVERRRLEWAKVLADVVEAIDKNVDELGNDEVFVSSVIRTSRIATSTHRAEKRRLLKNVLVKIGSGCTPDEDMLEIYFRLIEELTPSHIVVLHFLWMSASKIAKVNNGQLPIGMSYGKVFQMLLPDLSQKQDLLHQIVQDLSQRRLINAGAFGNDLFLQGFPVQMMTNHGGNFLNFVLSNEELHS